MSDNGKGSKDTFLGVPKEDAGRLLEAAITNLVNQIQLLDKRITELEKRHWMAGR